MMTTRSQTPLITLIIAASSRLYAQAHSNQAITENFSQGLDDKGMPLGWELKEKLRDWYIL
jgi:hypothetical protein